MDPKPAKYAPLKASDIRDLVQASPFAWVVSGGEMLGATPLPLRPRFDAEGRLIALIGHFARNNRQVDRLREDPRALLLFMGPHGYISPSWMSDRTQAPTWNYASVVFDCELTFIDDAEGIEAVLRDLIEAMEAGRDRAWSLDEMGERAKSLARGVVAFRADIRDVQPAFKLGQDERADVYADIVRGLTAGEEDALLSHMQAQNPERHA